MRKIFILFFLIFISPRAFGADLSEPGAFEAACLASGKDCLLTVIVAKSARESHVRNIRYLSSMNRADLVDIFQTTNYPKRKMYMMTSSAVLRGDKHWVYFPDIRSVIRSVSVMGVRDTVTVKLDWRETVLAPANSVVDFQEDFRSKPNEMRVILMAGTKHTPLYAEWVNKNVHYYHATSSMSTGTLIAKMSGWKKKYDGSFYIVTPISSWKIFAKDYMTQSLKMEGDTKVRSFQGDDQQKITAAVKWMASHYVWSGIYGAGTFPDQYMSKTVQRGAGDCKALDLVFRAVLRRSGIEAHASIVSSKGMPPLSYILPDASWGDHVITYIPSVGKYVDITVAIKHPDSWRSSAQEFIGATTLDMSTGRFAVIDVTREL